MKTLVFVGEMRSPTAIRMGVTWEDGRLAAKTLHEALRAINIDPHSQRYLNIFHDGSNYDVNERSVQILRSLDPQKATIVGLGRRVSRALEQRGIEHLQLIHPAARGSIRATQRYRDHVRSLLANYDMRAGA